MLLSPHQQELILNKSINNPNCSIIKFMGNIRSGFTYLRDGSLIEEIFIIGKVEKDFSNVYCLISKHCGEYINCHAGVFPKLCFQVQKYNTVKHLLKN